MIFILRFVKWPHWTKTQKSDFFFWIILKNVDPPHSFPCPCCGEEGEQLPTQHLLLGHAGQRSLPTPPVDRAFLWATTCPGLRSIFTNGVTMSPPGRLFSERCQTRGCSCWSGRISSPRLPLPFRGSWGTGRKEKGDDTGPELREGKPRVAVKNKKEKYFGHEPDDEGNDDLAGGEAGRVRAGEDGKRHLPWEGQTQEILVFVVTGG